MTNSKLLSISVLSILIITNFTAFSQVTMTQEDYDLMREDDPFYKIQREKWMNDMHRAAPGVNWRNIDLDTRLEKQMVREGKIKALLESDSPISEFESQAFANGDIEGEWVERGSNNLSGRMLTCDIDFESDMIYAASAGGNVWRSKLDGSGWECLNNGRRFNGIIMLKVIKKNNHNRIILVAGKRLFYSDNEGLTWGKATGLEAPETWGSIKRAIMLKESNTIYVCGKEWDYDNWKIISSVYKSNDLGETFEPVRKSDMPAKYHDLWTPYYESDDVYYIHRDTLSKIAPNGEVSLYKFIDIPEDFDDVKDLRLQGCISGSKSHLVVLFRKNSVKESLFYGSRDLGDSWNHLSTIEKNPFASNSFEVSSINPDYIYFGSVNLARSHDGAASWEDVNPWGKYYQDPMNKLHADIPAVTCFRDPKGGEIIIISTDGGAYISKDNCLTVKNISMKGLNVSQYYSTLSYLPDPDIIFAGSQDQGYQRSLIGSPYGTQKFQQKISGDYGHLTSSDSGKTLWGVYPGHVRLYKDFAIKSKTKAASKKFEGEGGIWMRPIIADPADPNIAYLAGGGTDGSHHIWKYEYNGKKLTSFEMPYKFDQDITAINISSLNTDNWYAMTKNGDFFYSSNAGESWALSESFDGLAGHYFYGAHIMPSPNVEGKVFIAGSGYSNPAVYVSNDYGKTFDSLNIGLPNTLVFRMAITPDERFIFAATPVGPYVYSMGKNMWFDLMDETAPDQNFWSVEYIPSMKTARFGTYGRGIWDFKIIGDEAIPEVRLISPEHGEYRDGGNILLDWEDTHNAEFYEIQVANDENFEALVLWQSNITKSEYDMLAVPTKTEFFWRVKAKSSDYMSTWSEIYGFATNDVYNSIFGNNTFHQFNIYPNPVSKTSVVEFSMDRPGRVNISVYNVVGEKVAVIFDGDQDSGLQSFKFSSANLPTGVYYLRLRVGNSISMKEVVINR